MGEVKRTNITNPQSRDVGVISSHGVFTLIKNYNLNNGIESTPTGGVFEPALGNPAVTGYILSSTSAGVRSWTSSGSNTLAGLDDYIETAIADNEIVSWDNGSGNYINQTAAELGISETSHTHSQYLEASDTPTITGIWTFSGQASFTHSSGTNSPFLVTSTYMVTNLNVEKVGGKSYANLASDFEADLGNPSFNGQVLSSTTLGVRTWTAAGATTMTELTDYTETAAALNDFIVYDTGVYVNKSASTIGISVVGHVHSQYLEVSDTPTITGVWTFSGQASFTHSSGTDSPFLVTSTYEVANLNVEKIGGKSLANLQADFEEDLGNPSFNGQALVSTTLGVRTWSNIGSSTLSGLDDIELTSVADKEILSYRLSDGFHINRTPAELGLSETSHNHNGTYYTSSDTPTITGVWTFSGQANFSHSSGTNPPFLVTSTYMVTNLNVEKIGGKSLANLQSDFEPALPADSGTIQVLQSISGTRSWGAKGATTMTELSDYTETAAVDDDFVVYDTGVYVNKTATALNLMKSDAAANITGAWVFTTGVPAFNGGVSGGSAPFTVDSTFLVTNLNAHYLGGQLYSDLQSEFEAAFSKNTGFNKNLGTSAGTVSEGNHGHSDKADLTANVITKTASYTLAAGDNGKVILFNTGSAVNLTMGTNLGTGYNVQVIQTHVTGVVTLVAGSATLNSKEVKLSSQWGGCSIVYNALNEAVAMGDLTAT